MKIKKELRELLIKKLEYKYKNSDNGKLVIKRLNDNDNFTSLELENLSKKLEYRFKNSDAGKTFLTELIT